MFFKLNDRIQKMMSFIIVICIIFVVRILFLNVAKGEEYRNIAQNSIFKYIEKPAPRGQITDKNGIVLADNRPIFTVNLQKNELRDRQTLNSVSLRLYDILESNNEQIIDEFPIFMKDDGKLHFTFDDDVAEFKSANDIDQNLDALDAFRLIVKRQNQKEGVDIDENAPLVDIQKALNEIGIYPPISIGEKVEFTSTLDKEQWLYSYGITDQYITAEDAFKKIRETCQVDPSLSYEDARKILLINDAINSKGYYQYEPVIISRDISQKTVSIINENLVELKGVEVDTQPVRFYPQGSLASHIIGQIGKISSNEGDLLEDDRYKKSDFIGKSGVEKYFEKELKGTNGYEKVQADAMGKKLRDMGSQDPKPGKVLRLSIDANLQKVTEDSLEKALTAIRAGGTYQSKWGNYKIKNPHPNATSGAIVVLDVKTGKVLSMASFPGYDPNIFTTGLTKEQYLSLQPENPNDPLSAKPQFNIATMTTVQPGSIFKMITGLAALEKGLDPNYLIEDKGFIKLGGEIFGTYSWNQFRQLQGMQNMVKALKDSNNYYFYCIGSGYDYSKDKPILGLENMGEKNIIDMAIKFGFNKKTGIEVYEEKGRVPDKKTKYQLTKSSLESTLMKEMSDSFTDIHPDIASYKTRIDEIVSWIDENPSRAELINRLAKLRVKEEKLEYLADLIKYTYFNSANWTTGDIFNIAIGQGENSYTPLQMANYVASIANGGHLNKVSLVDRVIDPDTKEETIYQPESKKIDINPKNLKPIQEGMLAVSLDGSAKELYSNFPVKVASKTGTAEKEGFIPAKDEKAYLLERVQDLGMDKKEVLDLATTYKKEDGGAMTDYLYVRKAMLALNENLTGQKIDEKKDIYDTFSWFVAYAPYEQPEIAVATILFQSGSGTYAGLPTRDVIAQYMGLNEEVDIVQNKPAEYKVNVEHGDEHREKIYSIDDAPPEFTSPRVNSYTNTYTPNTTPARQEQSPANVEGTTPQETEQVPETLPQTPEPTVPSMPQPAPPPPAPREDNTIFENEEVIQ